MASSMKAAQPAPVSHPAEGRQQVFSLSAARSGRCHSPRKDSLFGSGAVAAAGYKFVNPPKKSR
jgi:hypothetical protein